MSITDCANYCDFTFISSPVVSITNINKGSDLMPYDMDKLQAQSDSHALYNPQNDENVPTDWKGDSLGSANRIFKYEDELFDIEESDQMLKHIIEQMDVQESLDVLHDWGAEDID